MGIVHNNHHIGLEVVKCYDAYFTHHEKQLKERIDMMAMSNIQIKIISDVMNKLSHDKQKDKKADFSGDETMKQYVTHLHKNNPTIWAELIKGFPEHLPSDDTSSIQDITLETVLQDSLKNIDMGQISIQILNEEEIDIVVQGLDAELKKHSADLNEHMLHINEKYDNRSQMTEAARQVVRQDGDFKGSINRKMAGR
jgi:hypothetical protein